MNFNLQKLQNINKKKAEQADNLLKRCLDLEDANQKLLNIIPDAKISMPYISEGNASQEKLDARAKVEASGIDKPELS